MKDNEIVDNYKLDKVYVIIDNYVWDDEECLKVVGVAATKELGKECFDKCVEQVKDELDIEDGCEDDDYVIEDEDDYFSVYKDGEYNSYHTCIYLSEQKLIKESEIEENYEF